MRNLRKSRIARLAVATLVIGLVSCSSLIGIEGGGGGGTTNPPPSVALPDGIVQNVSISPESLDVGSDIVVRSVLKNVSAAPISIESRICGLNWGGNLRLTFTPGVATCGGWSSQGPLAPGDSVVSQAAWRLGSPSGEYTLYVGHLLSPSAYAYALPIKIR
jgi:hypothetical protein